MTDTQKNQPVQRIQVGTVKIAIWKNTHEGTNFYKGTVELSYNKNGEWKTTSHFGMRDLLNLGKAALMAHSAIGKLIRADKQAAGEGPDTTTDDEEIPY